MVLPYIFTPGGGVIARRLVVKRLIGGGCGGCVAGMDAVFRRVSSLWMDGSPVLVAWLAVGLQLVFAVLSRGLVVP